MTPQMHAQLGRLAEIEGHTGLAQRLRAAATQQGWSGDPFAVEPSVAPAPKPEVRRADPWGDHDVWPMGVEVVR